LRKAKRGFGFSRARVGPCTIAASSIHFQRKAYKWGVRLDIEGKHPPQCYTAQRKQKTGNGTAEPRPPKQGCRQAISPSWTINRPPANGPRASHELKVRQSSRIRAEMRSPPNGAKLGESGAARCARLPEILRDTTGKSPADRRANRGEPDARAVRSGSAAKPSTRNWTRCFRKSFWRATQLPTSSGAANEPRRAVPPPRPLPSSIRSPTVRPARHSATACAISRRSN
jgi:hypothetical protein